MTNELPPLPEGHRWNVRYKRAWRFADLQKKTWRGWRTVRRYDYYDLAQEFFYLGGAWA